MVLFAAVQLIRQTIKLVENTQTLTTTYRNNFGAEQHKFIAITNNISREYFSYSRHIMKLNILFYHYNLSFLLNGFFQVKNQIIGIFLNST